jgi:hypothetical protein
MPIQAPPLVRRPATTRAQNPIAAAAADAEAARLMEKQLNKRVANKDRKGGSKKRSKKRSTKRSKKRSKKRSNKRNNKRR